MIVVSPGLQGRSATYWGPFDDPDRQLPVRRAVHDGGSRHVHVFAVVRVVAAELEIESGFCHSGRDPRQASGQHDVDQQPHRERDLRGRGRGEVLGGGPIRQRLSQGERENYQHWKRRLRI